jgi:two-component system phosphate regulon sensor histidine kinase PhoR
MTNTMFWLHLITSISVLCGLLSVFVCLLLAFFYNMREWQRLSFTSWLIYGLLTIWLVVTNLSYLWQPLLPTNLVEPISFIIQTFGVFACFVTAAFWGVSPAALQIFLITGLRSYHIYTTPYIANTVIEPGYQALFGLNLLIFCFWGIFFIFVFKPKNPETAWQKKPWVAILIASLASLLSTTLIVYLITPLNLESNNNLFEPIVFLKLLLDYDLKQLIPQYVVLTPAVSMLHYYTRERARPSVSVYGLQHHMILAGIALTLIIIPLTIIVQYKVARENVEQQFKDRVALRKQYVSDMLQNYNVEKKTALQGILFYEDVFIRAPIFDAVAAQNRLKKLVSKSQSFDAIYYMDSEFNTLATTTDTAFVAAPIELKLKKLPSPSSDSHILIETFFIPNPNNLKSNKIVFVYRMTSDTNAQQPAYLIAEHTPVSNMDQENVMNLLKSDAQPGITPDLLYQNSETKKFLSFEHPNEVLSDSQIFESEAFPFGGQQLKVRFIILNTYILQIIISTSMPVIMSLLILTSLWIVVLFLLIHYGVTKPLKSLKKAMQNLAAGNFNHQLDIGPNNELSELAGQFRDMRKTLQSRLIANEQLLLISRELNRSTQLQRGLQKTVESAMQTSKSHFARLYLQIPTIANPLLHIAGKNMPELSEMDLPLMHHAIQKGKVEITNLKRAQKLFAKASQEIQSLYALPICYENKAYGVLWVGYTEQQIINNDLKLFLQSLSNYIAVACENITLLDHSEKDRLRLNSTLNAVQDAIIVTDAHERVKILNPAAEILFDRAIKNTVALSLSQLLANANLMQLSRLWQRTDSVQTVSVGHKTYQVSQQTLTDGSEQQGKLTVFRDISNFKKAETYRNTFIEIISHDLREPLNRIMGYAENLPLLGLLNPGQKDTSRKIQQLSKQLLELVEDNLNLRRIENALELVMVPCRVPELMQEVEQKIQTESNQQGQEIIYKISSQIPPVLADRVLLVSAISNLLRFAIHHNSPNGKIRVEIILKDGIVHFSAQDQGPLISPADRELVLEGFYSVESGSAPNPNKRGLAAARSVAQSHHGWVDVQSQLGVGNTYTFAIPLGEAYINTTLERRTESKL